MTTELQAAADDMCRALEELRAHIAALEADNKQLHKSLKGMLEVFADATGDCEDMHTVIAARSALAQTDGKAGAE